MVGPDQSRFHVISPELAANFLQAPITPSPVVRADAPRWTRFDEGEVLYVKGVGFRVHEIGETRMVLKLINA